MNFFKYFPREPYFFGDEETPDVFQNISIYADIIDEIKNNTAFYQDYEIQEFQRADQVSFELYGTINYHWTFYLMNDKLRERGWPVTNRDVIALAEKDYPLTTITTRTTLYDKFSVGQTISGLSSGATARIDHRHLDNGQIVVDDLIGNFANGETVSSINSEGQVETIVVTSSGPEYLAAHHYENAAEEYVDIDPTVGPGAQLIEITWLDRYVSANNELKQIKVIRPGVIKSVVQSFREAVRS